MDLPFSNCFSKAVRFCKTQCTDVLGLMFPASEMLRVSVRTLAESCGRPRFLPDTCCSTRFPPLQSGSSCWGTVVDFEQLSVLCKIDDDATAILAAHRRKTMPTAHTLRIMFHCDPQKFPQHPTDLSSSLRLELPRDDEEDKEFPSCWNGRRQSSLSPRPDTPTREPLEKNWLTTLARSGSNTCTRHQNS